MESSLPSQPPPPQPRTPAKNTSPPSAFSSIHTNLASSGSGAHVLFATDEWFATASNLLNPAPPIFVPDLYCEQGKVMDGWETRRKRIAGHDFAVIKLTGRGARRIAGIEIDTAHFTGNHVPKVSVEGAYVPPPPTDDGGEGGDNMSYLIDWMPGSVDRILTGDVRGSGATPVQIRRALDAIGRHTWIEILPVTDLRPGYEETRMHRFDFADPSSEIGPISHVKLNCYPDGGIARLRVWGEPIEEPPSPYLSAPVSTGTTCAVVPHSATDETPPSRRPYDHPELSSSSLGGKGLRCSNRHYGVPSNLLQPNLGRDMGDGWETARHPDRPSVWKIDAHSGLLESPLMDWAVIKLGAVAADGVSRIILDTKHFRGNFPESVQVDGCFAKDDVSDEDVCRSAAATSSSSEDCKAVVEWFHLVPRSRVGPDAEHVFDAQRNQISNNRRKVSHVRVSIYPDGGLSRVRVYGKATARDARPTVVRSHL